MCIPLRQVNKEENMGYMREDRLASAEGEGTDRCPGRGVDRRERRSRIRAWEGTREMRYRGEWGQEGREGKTPWG